MEDKTQPVNAEEALSADYANNVFFAANVWDLKVLFGELSARGEGVDWHTSITLPWAQAKLMAYYLAINIAAHEMDEGPIRIPESMIPPEPPPPQESQKEIFEFIKAHRQKFLDSLK